MSSTEIWFFDKDGDAFKLGETRNANRGAMAAWDILEKKYLKPLPKPDWMDLDDYTERGYRRSSNISDENALKEVWELQHNKQVSDHDMIVLWSTFDNVTVKYEDIKKITDAFRLFHKENPQTSFGEQADLLDKNIGDCIAIGWNQISVCESLFSATYEEIFDENGEFIDEVETLYNYFAREEHFDLFEEMKKNVG